MAKEYIEREATIEWIMQLHCDDCNHKRKYGYAVCRTCGVYAARNIIKDAPAADVVEVKHGEWISDDADIIFHCSECETQVSTSWDYESDWGYCPNCGARMDGKRSEK